MNILCAVSRVPAGSVYKMAHCLEKGLGLGLYEHVSSYYVTGTLPPVVGTLVDTANKIYPLLLLSTFLY